MTSVAAFAQATAAPISSATDQGGDVYRFPVGEIRVTALSDGTVPQDLHQLLKRITQARIDALLDRNFQSNPVEASINAYLIELPGRTVLVDTGSGELFLPGAGGKLLASLARLGTSPDKITDVLITHVHSDHAGGLVRGGQRVFMNAIIHVAKADLDFFADRSNAERTHYDAQYFDIAATTMKPYLDAGKVRPFVTDAPILPGITATLHPGHTPGSAFFTLESKGDRIVFVGDIVHSAAVQFPEVATTIAYDQDADQAASVRASAFTNFARGRELIAAPHMPYPGIGRVRVEGQGFAWVPVTYVNRAGK
jgi:glyoxylase-like metal-dependent hydrolase (beta-lactamase superfamily II)